MLALLPWADLLNHGSEATGIPCLVFDDETHVATLRAHTDYQPGQGVYGSYSPGESPGQLFLVYGFVDWGHMADTVDLPALVLRRGAGKSKRTLLRAVSLPAGDRFQSELLLLSLAQGLCLGNCFWTVITSLQLQGDFNVGAEKRVIRGETCNVKSGGLPYRCLACSRPLEGGRTQPQNEYRGFLSCTAGLHALRCGNCGSRRETLRSIENVLK